jgi:hypothetical protein
MCDEVEGAKEEDKLEHSIIDGEHVESELIELLVISSCKHRETL